MSKTHHATDLQMIPVDQIAVLNPRDRNDPVFEEIVSNIKSLGNRVEQRRTGRVMAPCPTTGGTRRMARNPASSADPGNGNAQPRTVGR